MKRTVKFQMLAAILMIAMMSCTSCKKDGGGNDPGDDPGGNGVSTTAPFKIKQATIESAQP